MPEFLYGIVPRTVTQYSLAARVRTGILTPMARPLRIQFPGPVWDPPSLQARAGEGAWRAATTPTACSAMRRIGGARWRRRTEVALAWGLRRETTVTLRRVGERLAMGHHTRVKQAVSPARRRPGRKVAALRARLEALAQAEGPCSGRLALF